MMSLKELWRGAEPFRPHELKAAEGRDYAVSKFESYRRAELDLIYLEQHGEFAPQDFCNIASGVITEASFRALARMIAEKGA